MRISLDRINLKAVKSRSRKGAGEEGAERGGQGNLIAIAFKSACFYVCVCVLLLFLFLFCFRLTAKIEDNRSAN